MPFVCSFHDHERSVEKIASEMGFTHISLSSRVMPMVRAVPRGYTGTVSIQCQIWLHDLFGLQHVLMHISLPVLRDMSVDSLLDSKIPCVLTYLVITLYYLYDPFVCSRYQV